MRSMLVNRDGASARQLRRYQFRHWICSSLADFVEYLIPLYLGLVIRFWFLWCDKSKYFFSNFTTLAKYFFEGGWVTAPESYLPVFSNLVFFPEVNFL
jgi:hypothetical protein